MPQLILLSGRGCTTMYTRSAGAWQRDVLLRQSAAITHGCAEAESNRRAAKYVNYTHIYVSVCGERYKRRPRINTAFK